MQQEIKQEMLESAENFVIQECKKTFKDSYINVGPFSCREGQNAENLPPMIPKKFRKMAPIIPDRERLNVMGVILDKVDNRNSIVTIAIVDKYGELVANKDFMNLLVKKGMSTRIRADEQPARGLKVMNEEDFKAY